jgi:hypothetical protein
MTPQEQELLQGLIQRVNQTQLSEKDPDAEDMLRQTLGRNPDALYILAQTILVQQYALDQAQKQLADARAQLDQLRQAQQEPRHATSFLGNLLGRTEEARPTPPPPPQYQQPPFTPVPAYTSAPPAGYAPAYGAPPQSGGFLRSALQTATGVAAGALAFEGIESLMHGFGHSAGYEQGFGGFGGSDRPEIINNYYGEDAPHEHSEHLSPDIEDRRGESAFSHAAETNDHGDQFMQNDDLDNDTDNFADSSSSDDFSGDFDSGSDDSSF